LRQSFAQLVIGGHGRNVEAQVYDGIIFALVVGWKDIRKEIVANISAATRLAYEQATPLCFGNCACDCAHGHAQTRRKVPVRGHLFARTKTAMLYVFGNRVGNRYVAHAVLSADIRIPHRKNYR